MLSQQLLIVSGGDAAALKNRREQREKMNSSAYAVNLSFDGFLSKEMSSTLLGPKVQWSFRKNALRKKRKDDTF